MNNKYSLLLSFLANATPNEFKIFEEEIDPRKLNFFFLTSNLVSGNYDIGHRCERLIMMMPKELWEVDALLYVETLDNRGSNNVRMILKEIAPDGFRSHGLQAFKKNS